MKKKEENKLRQTAYGEMEKCKPSEAAVEAFKHKPYKLDWKEKEDKNGKKR